MYVTITESYYKRTASHYEELNELRSLEGGITEDQDQSYRQMKW